MKGREREEMVGCRGEREERNHLRFSFHARPNPFTQAEWKKGREKEKCPEEKEGGRGRATVSTDCCFIPRKRGRGGKKEKRKTGKRVGEKKKADVFTS